MLDLLEGLCKPVYLFQNYTKDCAFIYLYLHLSKSSYKTSYIDFRIKMNPMNTERFDGIEALMKKSDLSYTCYGV